MKASSIIAVALSAVICGCATVPQPKPTSLLAAHCLTVSDDGFCPTPTKSSSLQVIPFRTLSAMRVEGVKGGGKLLRDGSVLAYAYSGKAKSGVEIIRFEPKAGRVLWQKYCSQTDDGVPSTGGYAQEAGVVLFEELGQFAVIVHGSIATVETRLLKNGAITSRSQSQPVYERLLAAHQEILRVLKSPRNASRSFVLAAHDDVMNSIVAKLQALGFPEFCDLKRHVVVGPDGVPAVLGVLNGKPFAYFHGQHGRWTSFDKSFPSKSMPDDLKKLLKNTAVLPSPPKE